jgi:23S rRNA (pseudouridine1915-N3)-methyltransferase
VRVRVVAVGKLKEAHYRSAVDEYAKRLSHYAEYSEVEVREGDVAAMRRAIPERAQLVLLVIDGRPRSSEELAAYVESVAVSARDLCFVIGGADGIPPEVLARPAERLSLGKMTLPHRLARLVLVEQLYRAMTIRRGEPYHH